MKAKNTTQRNDPGFTLIEVLGALTIFAIGILAVASMQISAINGNATANRLTTALTSVTDRVETLMAAPYTNADLDGTAAPGTVHTPDAGADGVDNDGDGTIDEAGETNALLGVTWTVVETAGENFKAVTVRANWTDRGAAKSATLDFIKADI
jgi:type IV pilus assembly protein PilV